jgi:tetratricopeptide (TPR) repeat protein
MRVVQRGGVERRIPALYIIVATGRDCAKGLPGAACRSTVDFVCRTKHFWSQGKQLTLNCSFSLLAALLLCVSFLSLPAWSADTSKADNAAVSLNSVGVAFMNQQIPGKALVKFEDAHRADQSSAIPLINKGIALIYLRRLPEAEQALKAASVLDPKSPRVWYSLGLALFDSGDQPSALKAFERAAELDPRDADTHYYLGIINLGLKNYDQAIPEFEKALQLSPLHASAQYGLARALQRSGKADEARKHVQRFQEITQRKIGTIFSDNYGEQGHYATAEDMPGPPAAVSAMITVTFAPAPAESGTIQAAQDSSPMNGGACIIDLEGTGQKDVVTMQSGANAIQAYRIAHDGTSTTIDAKATGLALSGKGIACAVGDYDNDGLPDLAIALVDRIAIFHNLGRGQFSDTTSAVGIRPLNHPAGLTFVDFDHDGDLDLFVTGSASATGMGPNVLWRNNGNSTFTEWTNPTGLAGKTSSADAILSDINNDRAIDLVVTGRGASPTIFENQREGAFRQVALYDDSALPATRGVSTLDFNKDGWMDVAVTHAGAPGLTLWKNVEGEHFERIALPLKDVTGAWGLTPIDFDNDGWIDLAVIVETSRGARLRVLRNCGAKGFEDVTEALKLENLDVSGAQSLIAADIDGDGAPDLIVARGNVAPLILHNAGGNQNHSLRIALTGLADNKSAIGTKVEVLSNGTMQKFEIAGSSGYLSQGPADILVGLGKADHADVVRMLWPTGVPQDEIDVTATKPLVLQELDRRGSSCPVLFAWDGKKYEFVSDVIGAAVVGHWMSPSTRNENDPDEWIKVAGSMLQSRNGRLSLRFGEPMEEINYIDQLRFVAIDHPEGTEVYPDERFLSEKPFASGAPVLASRDAHLPAGAWNDEGENVLSVLAKPDHKYVKDFKNLAYAGFANRHALTLDLGPWSARRPLRLFLHGFIEYFSATSLYAAWQAGIRPEPPSVEAQMPDGTWKTVIKDMGFPAGLPRTIVVDLTGKLSTGVRRIRMRTNLQIYWDQILVDNDVDSASSIHETELPLASASVAFRGYPKQVDGETPGDLTYDYQSISLTGPFQWQRGSYTRYGSVTPLLLRRDDKYVIFGSGDEIDAEFSDASLPALPPHWKRDYLFYANGYVKDMDFHEALPFTVAQLPFQSMSGYPYPRNEHFPEDIQSRDYRLEWNDRFESGNRTQLFQFHYMPVRSEPRAARP